MALFLGWLLLFLPLQDDPVNDLRALRWGMTSREVRTAEKLQPTLVSDTLLLYRQLWFSDLPASLELSFMNGRLAGARYLFTEHHVRASEHWEDYQRIVKVLSGRYGPPSGNNWTWIVPLYKDRPNRYGDAVLLGHLNRSNVWETTRTIITLEMSGTPGEGIRTIISYASKSRAS